MFFVLPNDSHIYHEFPDKEKYPNVNTKSNVYVTSPYLTNAIRNGYIGRVELYKWNEGFSDYVNCVCNNVWGFFVAHHPEEKLMMEA